MGKVKIIQPGLLTCVQDLGRYGYQQYGMPVAGAMDTYSMRLANYLVGNESGEACLEATIIGPELEFLCPGTIGICGGLAEVRLNGGLVEMYASLNVEKGDHLSFKPMQKGARLYISFAGGIDVPEIMESKSTYLRGGLGGFKGRGLQTGDEFSFKGNKNRMVRRNIPEPFRVYAATSNELRIIAGAEVQRFDFDSVVRFMTSNYMISAQSDRMGYRLTGPKLEHQGGPDILSAGISSGAIQVPGHGEPILMLADHQTVGGYTKIGNVISADLPILGQCKPGDKLYFREVQLDEAHKILKEKENMLKKLFEQ